MEEEREGDLLKGEQKESRHEIEATILLPYTSSPTRLDTRLETDLLELRGIIMSTAPGQGQCLDDPHLAASTASSRDGTLADY
jgi:hypothetical protein